MTQVAMIFEEEKQQAIEAERERATVLLKAERERTTVLLEAGKKKAAEEAAIKTTVEDGQDYGIPKGEIAIKLMRKYKLSEKDAKRTVELYWQ